MKLTNSKKGDVWGSLSSLGIGIATLTLVLVIAFLIIAEGQNQIVTIESINESATSNWTAAYNATRQLQTATATIPTWGSLIVIAGIGAILLGLVTMYRGRQ